MLRQYLRNWYLFLAGFRWLTTRNMGRWVEVDVSNFEEADWVVWVPQLRYQHQYPRGITLREDELIRFKKGWEAWGWKPFWLLYLFDYGAAVLLGRGVQSLSRAFQLFGESHHWGQTGPLLWGSVDLWVSPPDRDTTSQSASRDR